MRRDDAESLMLSLGADRAAHPGQTLLGHLMGTFDELAALRCPEVMCLERQPRRGGNSVEGGPAVWAMLERNRLLLPEPGMIELRRRIARLHAGAPTGSSRTP